MSLFLFSQNSMQLLLFAGDWIRLAPDSTRLCSLRSGSTKGYSPKPPKLIFWILYAAQKLYISKHFPYSKVTILGSPCGGVLVKRKSRTFRLKGKSLAPFGLKRKSDLPVYFKRWTEKSSTSHMSDRQALQHKTVPTQAQQHECVDVHEKIMDVIIVLYEYRNTFQSFGN